MRPSFGVLRARRGKKAQPSNVLDDLKRCLQPAMSTWCVAPSCHNVCDWPAAGGRPGRFCSRVCQERFDRERGRLIEEVVAIREALEIPVEPADRRYLENQLSRRVWLLERYPLPYKEQARLMALDAVAADE